MTQWIDDYTKRLDDAQRDQIEERRIRLLNADLIAGRGGEFFKELAAAAEGVSKELNLKLGSFLGDVEFHSAPGSFFTVKAVKPGGGSSASIKVRLDLKAQQITCDLQLASPRHRSDGEMKSARFEVDGSNTVCARYNQELHCDPAELASIILHDAFPEDFVLTVIRGGHR